MSARAVVLGAFVTLMGLSAVFAQNPPNLQLGTISGTLLNRDGAPAANMRVSVVAVEDPFGLSALLSIAQTDTAGRYRLENIRPGRYFVLAGRVDAPTYFPGVTAQTAATAVSLVPGQVVTGIDFRMLAVSGLRFAGRVIRLDGQGNVVPAAPTGASSPPFQVVAGAAGTAMVRLSGNGVTPVTANAGLVAPDGSFQFTNLLPGTYQLIVSPVLNAAQRLSVTLVDKDITDYQLILPFMVAVPGSMTIEGGGPIPRLQLEFNDSMPRAPAQGAVPIPPGPTRVSAGPAFTAQLRAGDQIMNLTGLPAGYTIRSITSGGVDLVRNPLKVATDTRPIQIVLGVSSPSPWVRATGRVDGRGEWHLLVNFNVNHPQLASALEPIFYLDGSFEFSMTLPGEHQVRVSPIGGPNVMSTVSVGQRGVDNAVIQVPGTTASTVGTQPHFAMRAVRVGGRIVGRARASRGARVRMSSVTVGETFNAPIYLDGSFEFPRLSPGTYTAEVYPPVPGARSSTITVGDSDMRDVRIAVPDTRDFNGRVQMEGNAPMPRVLTFSFATGASVSASLRVDGSFQVELPIGQRIGVAANSVPQGHSLVSLHYGSVDLTTNPIPSSESASEELRVTLRSTAPTASVSGRLSGLTALPSGAVVWLTDSAGVYQTLEAAVGSDRTFTFSAVAPGNYTARVSVSGATSTGATVPVVVPAGGNVAGIEIN